MMDNTESKNLERIAKAIEEQNEILKNQSAIIQRQTMFIVRALRAQNLRNSSDQELVRVVKDASWEMDNG